MVTKVQTGLQGNRRVEVEAGRQTLSLQFIETGVAMSRLGYNEKFHRSPLGVNFAIRLLDCQGRQCPGS
jgi:hypothetical protein